MFLLRYQLLFFAAIAFAYVKGCCVHAQYRYPRICHRGLSRTQPSPNPQTIFTGRPKSVVKAVCHPQPSSVTSRRHRRVFNVIRHNLNVSRTCYGLEQLVRYPSTNMQGGIVALQRLIVFQPHSGLSSYVSRQSVCLVLLIAEGHRGLPDLEPSVEERDLGALTALNLKSV